jgi:uncharacterized protein YbaR (Trm112 family)
MRTSPVRSWLADLLVDPVTGGRLRLEAAQVDNQGGVTEGWLLGPGDAAYPVREGIPRFVGADGPEELRLQMVQAPVLRDAWVRRLVSALAP